MSMEEITNLITNTGVTVVIIGYFIFRDWKFMDTLQSTLTTLTETVNNLRELIKEK